MEKKNRRLIVSDKDSKKPKLPPTIDSDVSGISYQTDLVKMAYITSERSAKRFARLLNIDRKELDYMIKMGRWDELRDQYRMRLYNTFLKDRGEILEARQAAFQRMEMYKLMDLEISLNDLEDHFVKHHDFFVRDSNGEIIRDGFGNPISRRIGPSKHELEILKNLQEAREINKKLLELRQEEEDLKKLKDGSVIDVNDYDIFKK